MSLLCVGPTKRASKGIAATGAVNRAVLFLQFVAMPTRSRHDSFPISLQPARYRHNIDKGSPRTSITVNPPQTLIAVACLPSDRLKHRRRTREHFNTDYPPPPSSATATISTKRPFDNPTSSSTSFYICRSTRTVCPRCFEAMGCDQPLPRGSKNSIRAATCARSGDRAGSLWSMPERATDSLSSRRNPGA